MKHHVVSAIGVRTQRTVYVRIAVVTALALLALATGIAPLTQSTAGAPAEIHAAGTFTTAFVTNQGKTVNIAEQTVGNLSLLARYGVSTFEGGLQGTVVSLQSVVRDDVAAHKAFQTNTGTFFGTLTGTEGSFSLTTHVALDRSRCVPFLQQNLACPNKYIPFEGRSVVVAGTGMSGLEGLCGGGTFHSVVDSEGLNTGVTVYSYTFRLGRDCKANDR
jgi:hypothetical protein